MYKCLYIRMHGIALKYTDRELIKDWQKNVWNISQVNNTSSI